MMTVELTGECKCGGKCGGSCGGPDCQCKKKHIAIAIDGPAGAGKTTLAKALAEKLGYVYVDTGAIYRAFAVHKLWLSKESGEPVSNETALRTFDLGFEHDESGEQIMTLFGENINSHLRTPEVSMEASNVGVDPAVREALLELQRRQAQAYDVVMEGRDIGTVVLPDAQVKIFLTASLATRANRRFKDLSAAGESPDFCQVMDDLRARDWQDTTRAVAPLKEACDAVRLDNTNMTFEETIEQVIEILKLRHKS